MSGKTFISMQVQGPGGISELIRIALPLILSSACDTVMMFVDRLFLSRLSGPDMAAVMAGGVTAFTFQTFILGLNGYSNAMVANRFGARQKTLCPVVTTQAILVAIGAYPLLLACIPAGFWLFDISGIAATQILPQRTYFSVLLFGSIIPLLRNCLSCFFSGIGKTRIVMIASFVSMCANVVLNYLLIFGKAGFPALGILGAGIGTVTAGAIGLVVLVFAYIGAPSLKQYEISRSLHFNKEFMKELWYKGSPSGLEMLLNLIAFTTLITTFHACGTSVATAITITFNWDMVSFVPLNGLNIAVMSLAGRYCGSRELHYVNRSAWSGMKCASIYSSILLGLYLLFPGNLVDLFLPVTGGADRLFIRETAIFMVRLICVYVFCDGVLQVFGGALRGTGDTLWVMVTSIIMHWTFALIAVILLHVFNVGAKMTWVAVIVVFVCYGPIFFLRFRSGKWKIQILRQPRWSKAGTTLVTSTAIEVVNEK